MATTESSLLSTPGSSSSGYQRPHIRTVSSSSTAYTGSQGYIHDNEYPSIDLDRDGLEDIGLPTAPRSAHTASPASRPALGSRLLSSFQNAQSSGSALTRSKTILHSRAKSLASFVPKLGSNQSSPDNQARQSANRLFGDLFAGESAPVRLGISAESPSKEKEESEFVMEYKPQFTERPSRRSMVPQTPPQQNTPTKTGWFGRKITTPSTPAAAAAPASDELANLDIWTKLFPHGPVEELTPHAFNDLLLNASTLLERMQDAYREKIEYIASIKPEMEVQREEAEEADTRSRHLKMQLEDMGRRAQEQELAMQALAKELEAEKRKDQDAAQQSRTIRHVKKSVEDFDSETTPRRRKRNSAGTEASDSGFESDIDRDTDSTLSLGYGTATGPSLALPALTLTRTVSGEKSWQRRQPSLSSLSGTTVMSTRDVDAWTRLRGENAGLKRDMEEMRRQVQDVIDLVGHVQM